MARMRAGTVQARGYIRKTPQQTIVMMESTRAAIATGVWSASGGEEMDASVGWEVTTVATVEVSVIGW